ncbi:MAG: hypothetical protein ACKVX9_20455 [Blastocatellia bacterium]
MKSGRNQISLMIPVLALIFASTAMSQEKAVRMKDLPPAVQATVKEQSKGARLRGLGMEVNEGKTFYEASLIVAGHGKDVLIDGGGNVVEVEEQVALNSLPPAVKAEILKQAGRGRIVIVESVTKNGALEFYEAHIKSGGRLKEVKVNLEGKLIP